MEKLTVSFANVFDDAAKKLWDKWNDWYSIVVHPSVIEYDYRIAWTWEEMDKRDKNNARKDVIRLAFWLPWRPYWKPLYSIRKSHRWKDRPLLWNFGSWKTDLIPDWR